MNAAAAELNRFLTAAGIELLFRVDKAKIECSLKKRNQADRLGLWRFLLLVFLTACSSGTWVDDPRNFKRVFDFSQPDDVKVLHSYYWKSPHWTVEYKYFIVLQPSEKFSAALMAPQLVTAVAPDKNLADSCGDERPSWFLAKPITNYDAWVSKAGGSYRLFRDKTDGTLSLCDERL